VDTGIDLDHPDLRHRLWHNPAPTPAPLGQGTVPVGASGWDLRGADPEPDDRGGHGTVVGGLIGAEVGNGFGIDGVARNAQLMALRACTKNPAEEIVCQDSSYGAALAWAAEHGARVVHMSWSLGGGPAVDAAVAAHPDTLFVAPAGNGFGTSVDGGGPPSNCKLPYDNVVCVAGSTRRGNPTDCTAFGPASVDLAAPGVGLSTTLRRGRYREKTPCAVTFAAPHVSGVAALLFGADPSASVATVKQALLDGARRDKSFRGLTVTGGVVNAQRSLQIIKRRLLRFASGDASTEARF
jgi:subtilisin family serine protease